MFLFLFKSLVSEPQSYFTFYQRFNELVVLGFQQPTFRLEYGLLTSRLNQASLFVLCYILSLSSVKLKVWAGCFFPFSFDVFSHQIVGYDKLFHISFKTKMYIFQYLYVFCFKSVIECQRFSKDHELKKFRIN